MQLSVTVKIAHLWGEQEFRKETWGAVNYLVGPNATGKTLFADKLREQCRQQGLKPRHLNAERLVGLERQNYSYFGHSQMQQGLNIGQFAIYKQHALDYGLSADAFVILREKLDLKVRIEATLSQLFHRRIRLVEQGGFLVPKVQRIMGGEEYGLRESECHGLKELITLLTFVYDDEHDCLIVDEPELHLHPQFQSFFLQEVRKIAGDPRGQPGRKLFFLITHSPYFVDIRTLDDLKSCVVFQPGRCPASVSALEPEDEYRIKRLLPRLNTHHKQFFFASRPVFVEGYLDQQLFALIQERRGKLLGASGACLIDVGGKDELDVFFRLCKVLGIEAQVVADLDALLYGKLRQSVYQDRRCRDYLSGEGLGVDPSRAVGDMESTIDECLRAVQATEGAAPNPAVEELRAALAALDQSGDDNTRQQKKRLCFLIATDKHPGAVERAYPPLEVKVTFVRARLGKILAAFREANVHLLPSGELENHLPSYTGSRYAVSDGDKLKVFEREREYLLREDATADEIEARYGELTGILDAVSMPLTVNMGLAVSYVIGDWIHKVQSAVRRGEVTGEQALRQCATVEWASHARIFDLVAFSWDRGAFECRVRLKRLLDPFEREVQFDHETVAASFALPGDQPDGRPALAVRKGA